MEAIQTLLTNVIPIVIVLGWALLAYIVLIWAATVLWTYRDIRSRSEDVVVQVLAVSLALLLPFAGLVLHLILRPRQTLGEKYERTLEEQYLRRDLEDPYVCPSCQRGIEPDFILCPHCHTSLRRHCDSCNHVIDLTWSVCPYCGDDGSGKALHSVYRRAPETQPVDLFKR